MNRSRCLVHKAGASLSKVSRSMSSSASRAAKEPREPKTRKVTKDDVVFRPVSLSEAAKVCDFGRKEMMRSFSHNYSESDVKAYLAESYQALKYEEWIQSKEHLVYGAFLKENDENDPVWEGARVSHDSGKIMAYVLAGPCDLPLPADEMKSDDEVEPGEIKRLYAHPRTHGSGIAEQLIHDAMAWLRTRIGKEGRDVYLGVYSDNPRAIKFYEKHGFRLCGEYPFRVGKRFDREFIMKNTL